MSWFSTPEESAPRPDEEVLMRSMSRPWEYGELVTRYEDAFLRKALSIVYNREDAEEIVQDTFTKIYVNAHRYVPTEGATFRSWAYRILINTAITYYNKKRRQGERLTNLHPEYEGLISDADGATVTITKDAVDRMLAKLPSHFALVLRLHYVERWPQQAIAEELGETIGSIKVRIYRAKQAFKKLSETEWKW